MPIQKGAKNATAVITKRHVFFFASTISVSRYPKGAPGRNGCFPAEDSDRKRASGTRLRCCTAARRHAASGGEGGGAALQQMGGISRIVEFIGDNAEAATPSKHGQDTRGDDREAMTTG